MGRYDRHGKWLIGRHGDAILRLGGLAGEILSWHAAQAEVVEPAKLPDGFLEVHLAGRSTTDGFILEIMTYPDRQVYEQLQRDVALVYAQRRVVPEVLVVVLCPKGQAEIGPSHALASRLAWTRWETSWRVVQLWQVPEEELWAIGDAGIVPWIPLSRTDRTPEAVLDECRERIEKEAPPRERENLLAVTQVFTWLRFKDNRLLERLGGRKMISESELIRDFVKDTMGDVIQEQIQERTRVLHIEDILVVLDARFGTRPADVRERLNQIQDAERLQDLLREAAHCSDVAAFRASLQES